MHRSPSVSAVHDETNAVAIGFVVVLAAVLENEYTQTPVRHLPPSPFVMKQLEPSALKPPPTHDSPRHSPFTWHADGTHRLPSGLPVQDIATRVVVVLVDVEVLVDVDVCVVDVDVGSCTFTVPTSVGFSLS